MKLLDFFRNDSPDVTEQRRPGRRYRRFSAAKTDRLSFGFTTEPKTLNQDLATDLPTLTARARDLAKNDDYVRRFLKIAQNNVIGPRGIELRAQYRDNFGRGQNPNNAAINAVEAAWKDWGKDPEVTGRLTWVDCQCLALTHLARDGEILVRKQPRGRYGFQIQFIDPLTISHRFNKVLNNDREVIMGVEIDRRLGFVTAYYLRVNQFNQPNVFTFEGRPHIRIPADELIHVFRQEEVHQVRGFTPLASAIKRIHMLNGYEDAALVAARAGAAKMGFYQQSGDQPYEGDDEDEQEEIIEDFEAGVFGILPRGWDVKAFDTNWPNVDHAAYLKSVLRGIASGIGVSYNTLANDLEGVNFSSIRAGVLEDREEWQSAQEFFAHQFCQPVFEPWLDSSLVLGLIRNNGQAYNRDRFDEFRKVTWQGRRWAWVDPKKDIDANVAAIGQRIRSISDVIREQGKDPDEVFAEIKREQDLLRELGIEVQINDGNRIPSAEAEDAES